MRRVLAVLEHHRRGLELWVDAVVDKDAASTRWHLAIQDDVIPVEGLVYGIMGHWVGPRWKDTGYSSAWET